MNFFSILFTLIVYLLREIQGKVLNEYVNANIVSRQKFSFCLIFDNNLEFDFIDEVCLSFT